MHYLLLDSDSSIKETGFPPYNSLNSGTRNCFSCGARFGFQLSTLNLWLYVVCFCAQQLAQVTRYKWGKLGHFSRDCKNLKTSRNFKSKVKSLYHIKGASSYALGLTKAEESNSVHMSDDELTEDIDIEPSQRRFSIKT